MIAQLFGAGPLGLAHPYTLGLALSLAWALTISVSPISAMAIITGRALDLKPHHVTYRENRRFFVVALLTSLVLVCGVFLMGG